MSNAAGAHGSHQPTERAADLGLAAVSAIQNPLRDLVEAGLLLRLPTTAGKTYYERVESSAWSFAKALVGFLETVADQAHRG